MKPFFKKGRIIKNKKNKKRGLNYVIPQLYNGFLVNFVEFERNTQADNHYHPDGFEILFLLKGKIEYEDGTILNKRGDIICFPSNFPHSGKFKKGTQIMVFRNSSHKILI